MKRNELELPIIDKIIAVGKDYNEFYTIKKKTIKSQERDRTKTLQLLNPVHYMLSI